MPPTACRAWDIVPARLFYAGFGAAQVPEALGELPVKFDVTGMEHGCLFEPSEAMPLPTGNRDIAFIPDADPGGIPFSGALPLARFTAGPYRGNIRPDLRSNFTNAAYNHLANLVLLAHPEPHAPVQVELILRATPGQTSDLAKALGSAGRVSAFQSYLQLPKLMDEVAVRLMAPTGRARWQGAVAAEE